MRRLTHTRIPAEKTHPKNRRVAFEQIEFLRRLAHPGVELLEDTIARIMHIESLDLQRLQFPPESAFKRKVPERHLVKQRALSELRFVAHVFRISAAL